MIHQFKTKKIDDIEDCASEIASILSKSNVNLLLFYGEMGAGKTTLIRGICIAMGVTDSITSPTFALVNEYLADNNKTIFHFDLYRIETIRELYDIGFEDYFFSNELCMIEWPERASELFEELSDSLNIAKLTISVNEKEHREISLEING